MPTDQIQVKSNSEFKKTLKNSIDPRAQKIPIEDQSISDEDEGE